MVRHYANMLEHGEGISVNKNETDKYYEMASEKDKHIFGECRPVPRCVEVPLANRVTSDNK